MPTQAVQDILTNVGLNGAGQLLARGRLDSSPGDAA